MLIKIGVSGEAGSFSDEAGVLYANREGLKVELVYAVDMEGVLDKLDKGEIEIGIFPVVNSQGGLVRQAFEAMGRHLFTVVDELWLEVQQCLLALPNLSKENITSIVSHPQAIIQCQRYIKREFSQAKVIEWEDTAKAARDLAQGILPSTSAVIAPARSAALYDLQILERGIQDMHPNLTTFVIVKKLRNKEIEKSRFCYGAKSRIRDPGENGSG